MKNYDEKYHFLTNNLVSSGEFEALVVYNHFDKKTQHGMHAFHNDHHEQTIKEFVNRDSVGPVDDLHADTILTYSLMDEPLMLVFCDL